MYVHLPMLVTGEFCYFKDGGRSRVNLYVVYVKTFCENWQKEKGLLQVGRSSN